MDTVNTSLEALIQRITSILNEMEDTRATDAFVALINREPACTQHATKLIIARVHSNLQKESFQALRLLDVCMERCDGHFLAEIGKFRFLNELIKLVSPKYLGALTHESVRHRVIEFMYNWTIKYPKETKIKEAFEMLIKQGVVVNNDVKRLEFNRQAETWVKDSAKNKPPPPISVPKPQASLLDEEKSKLLQKLLQSKNPDDLHAANRLIKNTFKEDEKKMIRKSQYLEELNEVNNNVKLLDEMLESYNPEVSSLQDLELIKELHARVHQLRPIVFKLATDCQLEEESLFNKVLMVNDHITELFDKYKQKIVDNSNSVQPNGASGSSLLDLSTPNQESLPAPTSLQEQFKSLDLSSLNGNKEPELVSTDPKPVPKNAIQNFEQTASNLSILDDLFSSPSTMKPTASQQSRLEPSIRPMISNLSLTDISFGTYGNVVNLPECCKDKAEEKPTSKLKALEDLDILSETLLKENLSQTIKKSSSKVPMNLLNHSQPASPVANKIENASLDSLKTEPPRISPLNPHLSADNAENKVKNPLNTDDDLLIDINPFNEKPKNADQQLETISSLGNVNSLLSSSVSSVYKSTEEDKKGNNALVNNLKSKDMDGITKHVSDKIVDTTSNNSSLNSIRKVEPLGDLNLPLESIKPSTKVPWTLIDEANNSITVKLYLSETRPRSDVAVFVITATSKNKSPLHDYLFQPVVPKTCRLKLLTPSATDLPAHNPFLPPPVISQVMLIASPTMDPITLKYVLSYTMDNETLTEMGEVRDIPMVVC